MCALCYSMPALVLLCVAAPAGAETEPDAEIRYLLGAALQYGPEYGGARSHGASVNPVWALRWGQWRFSSSGGAALMGFGQAAIGPGAGASRDLFQGSALRIGVGLRLDGGRTYVDEGEDSNLAGLPKVRRTLRGRLYAAYTLAPGWDLSGALSQDLAGRDGGLIANIDLSRVLYRNASAELLGGLGLAGGDSRYMHSYFGVPAGSAGAARLGQVYQPGAGLREANLRLGFTYAFSAHWVGLASAGLSQLLGPAAASPITERTLGHSVGLSLAYRN